MVSEDIKNKARDGDTQALLEWTRKRVKNDQTQEMIDDAADGNGKACFKLWEALFSNKVSLFDTDNELALLWLERGTDAREPCAWLAQADLCYLQEKPEDAAKWYKKTWTELRDERAGLRYACLLIWGMGVKKNVKKGVGILQEIAAEKPTPAAEYFARFAEDILVTGHVSYLMLSMNMALYVRKRCSLAQNIENTTWYPVTEIEEILTGARDSEKYLALSQESQALIAGYKRDPSFSRKHKNILRAARKGDFDALVKWTQQTEEYERRPLLIEHLIRRLKKQFEDRENNPEASALDTFLICETGRACFFGSPRAEAVELFELFLRLYRRETLNKAGDESDAPPSVDSSISILQNRTKKTDIYKENPERIEAFFQRMTVSSRARRAAAFYDTGRFLLPTDKYSGLAKAWFERAHDYGHETAITYLLDLALIRDEYDYAFYHCRNAVKSGRHNNLQWKYGLMVYLGLGTKKDTQKGMNYIRAASEDETCENRNEARIMLETKTIHAGFATRILTPEQFAHCRNIAIEEKNKKYPSLFWRRLGRHERPESSKQKDEMRFPLSLIEQMLARLQMPSWPPVAVKNARENTAKNTSKNTTAAPEQSGTETGGRKTQGNAENKMNWTDIVGYNADTGTDNTETSFSPMQQLDRLIGLTKVKETVKSVLAKTEFSRQRKAAGLPLANFNLHLVFSGNPGTGKTTVARILGQILKEAGYLKKGHVVEVSREDLIGEYAGQTAKMVAAKIKEAQGGILFIDEAYSLAGYQNVTGAYAASMGREQEAIETLLQYMENKRGDFIVIAAGYTKEMENFLSFNPGLRSRFAETVTFPDFSSDELLEIFLKMAEDHHYKLTEEAQEHLGAIMRAAPSYHGSNFSNARFVRNLFETTLRQLAMRVTDNAGKIGRNLTLQEMTTIEKDDLTPPADMNLSAASRYGMTAEEQLEELIGMDGIKENLRAIGHKISYLRKRKKTGAAAQAFNLHFIFRGNPGTGKTTVARILGDILRENGYLEKGHVVEVSAKDLIGEFIGQTAPQTSAKINEAMGGILFIDEAYSLIGHKTKSGSDFSEEAISTLLQEMENKRGKFVVVAAGYSEEMGRFVEYNPGLRSRFTEFITFPDFSPRELHQIFLKMAVDNHYTLSEEAEQHARKIFADVKYLYEKDFPNGRFVRNLFENTLRYLAVRVMTELSFDEDESSLAEPSDRMTRIEKSDIEQGFSKTTDALWDDKEPVGFIAA
ncbi:MAG: AAA family ATPase [Micavibrio sp.]|nr:MAG: AAA family ATPase [Micavibrio sp.]